MKRLHNAYGKLISDTFNGFLPLQGKSRPEIKVLPDPDQGPVHVRRWHPRVDEMIDTGPHHGDHLRSWTTSGHGPVYQVKQR
jgi:hypothetical protein